MDRLDNQIMEAKKQYKPSKDFTKSTMQKINKRSGKQNSFSWFKVFTLSGMTLLVVSAIGFSLLHKNIKDSFNPSDTVATTTDSSTSSQPPTQAQTTAQATANEINTDLAQLDKEVSGYTVSYSDTSLDNINQ